SCSRLRHVRPRPPPSSRLPYTTLFRSEHGDLDAALDHAAGDLLPSSEAPAIRALRGRTDAHLRELLLGTGTSAQLWRYAQRPERSEEHTSELQSRFDLVCRLLLEKKNR